jgi:glycosyltransferase involved in cell wall biosynthesis
MAAVENDRKMHDLAGAEAHTEVFGLDPIRLSRATHIMPVPGTTSVALPVVTVGTRGQSDVIRRSGTGMVVDESKQSLLDNVRRHLLGVQLGEEMTIAAYRTAGERYGAENIADWLLDICERGGYLGFVTQAGA